MEKKVIRMEFVKATKNMLVYKNETQPEYAQGCYFMKEWVPKDADGDFPKQIQVTFELPEGGRDAD